MMRMTSEEVFTWFRKKLAEEWVVSYSGRKREDP
jgi:3'-phosphoadenosine 5'-phosphosulfate sulfotransferase (PAPS reductase)/FAD synthetase